MKSLILVLIGLFVAVGCMSAGAPEGVVAAMSIPAVDSRGLFTKSLLTSFRESVSPDLFLKSFFPSKVKMTKNVSIEVQRGTEKVATDVIRGTNGNRNTFSKSTERIYTPPLYHEYFTVSELEVYDRAMAQESPAAFADMVRKTAEYMQEQRYKIERACELQCSQVLQTGIVLLSNGDNIDYKRKATSMVDVNVLGSYWTAAGGDPIQDFTNGAEFLRTIGKYKGGTINAVCGSKALNALINNDNFKERADIRNLKLDEIRAEQRNSEGARPYGIVEAGAWQIRLWTYPGFYEDADGNMTPFIDEENVIMLPDADFGETAYARVPQVFTDQNQRPQSGEYLVRDYVDQRAATHEAHIKSAPLSIPVKVDQIYTMQVVAS